MYEQSLLLTLWAEAIYGRVQVGETMPTESGTYAHLWAGDAYHFTPDMAEFASSTARTDAGGDILVTQRVGDGPERTYRYARKQ